MKAVGLVIIGLPKWWCDLTRKRGIFWSPSHTRTRFLFSGAANRQVTPDQLATLIRLQNDALLKVAAQVAGMHEMVERLRSEWNSRTGQDPFEVRAAHV